MTVRPPAATTRAAAPSTVSGDCAGHCGESRAPSGDNARRSPFCSLWRRAPQPLLQPLEKTGFSNILPAALTMRLAGAPSGDNARHSPFCSVWRLRRPLRREPGPQRRQRAFAGAPSGDNARRSPFCSLWRLRRPLQREPGPQRRQRAPRPLETTPATAERAGPPAATTRAAASSATTRAAVPSAVSGDCAGHCRESRAPSGDNARRGPFCSLWRLCRSLRSAPGPQRRQRAPQPLLHAVSGDYAGHCGGEM